VSKFGDAIKNKRAKVRFINKSDMPEVLAIEKDCYLDAAWSLNDFKICLRQPSALALVATHKTSVVGFLVYEMQPDQLEILNICADLGQQRCGIGSALIDRLKIGLGHKERTRISILVRESNLAGQLFLKQQGFLATAIYEDYYRTDEDTSGDIAPSAYRFDFRLKPIQ